jgi:uncharacterized protein YidB (DUF937 family)
MANLFDQMAPGDGSTEPVDRRIMRAFVELLFSGPFDGLFGLQRRFLARDLNPVFDSWVHGSKRKLPISPEEVVDVLGVETTRKIAEEAGLAGGIKALQPRLARIMPVVVEELTPSGELPDPKSLAYHISRFRERYSV